MHWSPFDVTITRKQITNQAFHKHSYKKTIKNTLQSRKQENACMKVGVETTVNTVSIVTIHALEKRLSQRPFEKTQSFL